jgi:hypothetical protein
LAGVRTERILPVVGRVKSGLEKCGWCFEEAVKVLALQCFHKIFILVLRDVEGLGGPGGKTT